MPPSLRSRALGSIWGVCVVDALGGPVQFLEPRSFAPITDLAFVTPFEQPAGSYSDDGAMTLALAQSLIDSNGKYDHTRSITYFLQWLDKGRFSTVAYSWDVGISTRRALSLWKEHGTRNLAETQRAVDRDLDREECSGNGSLMRIAPVGVAMWRTPVEARDVAVEQSRVTHPAIACRQACEVYIDLLCRVMRGENKEQLCDAISKHQITQVLAERLSRYRTVLDWSSRSYTEIRSTGWVVDTLEVALWGLFKFDSFVDGALAVVNLGGDSDTAGAVYGGIAGAFYGYESVPADWVERMQNKRLIGEIASKLAVFAEGSEYSAVA